jgi:hypothetical protein
LSADDQKNWVDFSFSSRQWLCFANPNYAGNLNYVEEHSKLAVTFLAGTACKAPSPKLYAILAWSAALQTIAPSSTSS